MPVVDEQSRSRIAARHFVVLLGLSDAETNSGLVALDAADLPFREVSRAHFRGQLWGYTAVLIEMKSSGTTPALLLFSIPLARLELDPMAASDGSISLSPLGDGLRVITAARQLTNSLRVRLRPLLESVRGEVVLRVRLQVVEGTVGVYVVTSGNAVLSSEADVDVTEERGKEVYLKIPDVSAAEWLFIRNESPDGPKPGGRAFSGCASTAMSLRAFWWPNRLFLRLETLGAWHFRYLAHSDERRSY